MDALTIGAFAFGILAGEVADFLFDWANKHNIEGGMKLLHWLEHYHWGMILLFIYNIGSTYLMGCDTTICALIRQITDSTFLAGFGLSLILDENRSETRFAWKKMSTRKTVNSIISMKVQSLVLL
jgi:hypothetical protein